MITYTEKGIGLHDAIHNAGQWLREENGAWISSDDVAVQVIIDAYDPIVNIRADLFAAVKAERDRRQQLGMAYAFPDGVPGTIQTRGEQDLININGQVTAALVLLSQGVNAPVLTFRDEQNITHNMAPAETIEMGMAVSQFVSATYAAKWQHDTAIAAWDGVTPYDISSYWPT
jgi:hypothetical protein